MLTFHVNLPHMKCQELFCLKNNDINFRMLSATNLLIALRVNIILHDLS